MKPELLIIFAVVLIAPRAIFAQGVEKQIIGIRAEVNAINKAARGYKKTTKNLEGVPLEGTEATYFVSGKGLRKISAKVFSEAFDSVGEYYFQGEELIFAYEKESKYDGLIGRKNLKVVKVEERRMYFSGWKMIRYLRGKKEIKPGSAEFEEVEHRVMESSDLLKEAYDK